MTPSPPSRTRRLGALLAAAVVAGSALGASPAVAVDAAPDASRPAASAPARTAASTAADPNADGYDSFIVTYKETASVSGPKGRALAWGKAAKEAGVSVKELRETALGSHVIATDEKLSPSASAAFMADLKASSLVEAVEPNAIMTASGLTPTDPSYGQQWGFTGVNGMRVPGAWDSTTGTGSIVAVIDTGITSHADLNANVVAGYDFISNTTSSRDGNGRDANPADEGDWYLAGECGDPNPSNSSWHGTHVAGTVAAAANTVGVVGVAPNAKIQPVRVLGKCGGSLADIADAIVWSAGGSVPGAPLNATPADVINMSLGGSGTCGTTYQNAINAAVGRGVPVVVAAGNENQPAANARPANCQNTITVAASDSSGRRSSFSNYGSAVDVTAPGSSIISTVNTGTTRPSGAGYASYNGTSMATPHVAGLTALMLTKQPRPDPGTGRVHPEVDRPRHARDLLRGLRRRPGRRHRGRRRRRRDGADRPDCSRGAGPRTLRQPAGEPGLRVGGHRLERHRPVAVRVRLPALGDLPRRAQQPRLREHRDPLADRGRARRHDHDAVLLGARRLGRDQLVHRVRQAVRAGPRRRIRHVHPQDPLQRGEGSRLGAAHRGRLPLRGQDGDPAVPGRGGLVRLDGLQPRRPRALREVRRAAGGPAGPPAVARTCPRRGDPVEFCELSGPPRRNGTRADL